MHDVVRDVALLIASEGKNNLLMEAGKYLTEGLPLLDKLQKKNGKIPKNFDEFVPGIKEVKILDMAWNEIKSLPQSLMLLTNLRMLNLEGNENVHEISILGELKGLEILILNHTGIEEIPRQIGQLVNLKRLEIIHCRYLSHITPGVITKLLMLEELCIQLTWVREGVYDCLIDVMKLLKLTYLELMVPTFDMIPEGFNSEKLKGFVIQIGRDFRAINCTSSSERYLVIHKHYVGIPFLKWIKTLIEVSSPHVSLRSIRNLKNILPDLYDEGFHKLEYIELNDCPNVSCLVDSTSCAREQGKTKEKFFMELKHLYLYRLVKLGVLWNCTDQYISLTNLVNLDVHGCNGLVRVFPVSVAQGLVNLKELRISASDGLKEVIWHCGDDEQNNGGDTEIVELSANIIVFPCLATIKFYELRSLECFSSGDFVIKYPSLVYVTVKYCNSMKIWGHGIHETPKLKFVDEVPILDGPNALNDAVAKSVEAWKKKQDEETE